jgi:hypothetical protein
MDLEIVVPSMDRQQKIVKAYALHTRNEAMEAVLLQKRQEYMGGVLLKYACGE